MSHLTRLLESWVDAAQAFTHAQLTGILIREQFFQALPFDIAALVQAHNPATLSDMMLFADQLATQPHLKPKGLKSWKPAVEKREGL